MGYMGAKGKNMDEMERQGLCPFTYAQPGDTVFSSIAGFGNIVEYDWNNSKLSVLFDSGNKVSYTLSGFRCKSQYDFTEKQELFWDEDCTKKPMMPTVVRERDRVYMPPPFVG